MTVFTTAAAAGLIVSAAYQPTSLAFSLQSAPPPSSINILIRAAARPTPTTITSSTSLHMSSIPDDNDDINSSNNNNNNLLQNRLSELDTQFYNDLLSQLKNKLPPLPQDNVALSGDIIALFTYTYFDHFMNELFAEAGAQLDVAELVTYDPNTVKSGVQLPVWFDTSHLQTFGTNWLVNSHPEDVYAPAIAASGLAFVSIATCWIICGYFSGAFLHKKTLECDSGVAMLVTFQTWIAMAFFMVLLALGSDFMWGQLDIINALSMPARGGLTVPDADFIFDSLTVLAFWRFMWNRLFGYR